MDNHEAKFILSAYRPSGQDAPDPRFAEALEQARRDPVLERWFRESIAFDKAVVEKLGSVDVPAGLRENILSGLRASRPPRRRSSALLKWAMAAAVILIAIVGSIIMQQIAKPRLAGWQTEALDTISALGGGHAKFDAQSPRGADLVAWLRTNRALAAPSLPKNLEKLESLGCKTFFWKGKPVSVICFVRSDGGLIHLVMSDASGESDQTPTDAPRLIQRRNWATATWREGKTAYMLALEGSPDQLQSYLL